ncbi:glycosyltransferase [uncultured Flavobacterium sp.]|uniref:glycosyltransferase n=1 Tax=uncultured Flavobacterium sp. TaxID=165435 RepID=UPI00259910F2|nr:glycosyltransferase [uncultured Flavobacterium sp.]
MKKFVIITHVNHIRNQDQYYGYAPYVREMNLWLQYVDQLIVVAPLKKDNLTSIDLAYNCNDIFFSNIPDINFITFKSRISSVFKLPVIFWKIFLAMYRADHIHLRCPGNIGLIGCFVQILFPKKVKTAKYAGNWDPKSKQPWTYRLQKYILNNTILTRNMQVLVYGNWDGQSKNIKSFFTATYSQTEKEVVQKKSFQEGISFVFAGSLSKGKNPLYAIQIVNQLLKKGYNITFDLFGEGEERNNLQRFIFENKIEKFVFLHGNQDKETIKKAMKESHFVILPSKSEGWPKVIAEGMFWGCVALSTNVSCVSDMLDNGKRGMFLTMNLEKDVLQIEKILNNESEFFFKSKLALTWSQEYTTEVFNEEIKKLMLR